MAWRRRTPKPGESTRVTITILVIVIGGQILSLLLLGNEDRPLRIVVAFLISMVLLLLAFATRWLRFAWERVPD